MKKIIACVAAAAIVMSCFSACGPNAGKTTVETKVGEIKIGSTGGLKLPLTDKSPEMTMIVASNQTDFNDKYAVQKLRELTGINLQINAYPASTIFEKVKAIIASKNMPDIIMGGIGSTDTANDIGMQGALAPVNDYIEKMPNFKRTFVDNKENSWIFQSFQASDGNLYTVPSYDCERQVNHGMLYRKDIFDKHGIKEWNSDTEFYEAMKKLKSIYPSSTPFTSKNGDLIFNKLSFSWGLNAGLPYYDETSGVWKFSDTDPEFKNMLDYLRKLYAEGLIDQEFLTLTQAAWTSKMTQQDKAFATFDWIGRLDMFQEQTRNTLPEYNLRYGNPMGPKQTYQELPKVAEGTAVVAKNGQPELSFQLIDFLMSDAGAELMTMGIEGETYVLDENGMAKYIEFPEDKKIGINDLEDKYGMFVSGLAKRFDRRSIYFNFSEREQEAQDKVKDKSKIEPADPKLAFTAEEKEIITKYMPNLTKAAKEFNSLYVLGTKTGDAAWNEWLDKAKSLGVDEVVKAYNDAQARYDAAKK
ncbi:extracellular solute-binding protein [Acetivibrio sp. MSJd-27]|uniref:extracellular solute-binding protein n=1 Tax=Acetivibrio sp. MSJd-27 TaxID=2841523 RepID=UPI001C10EEDE|nr:extracellular solute-binding protein [Acetivibrio sp. MSJd-27]MBU5451242.1 extracellular solute-binding protein [Acetivibrio sp. MSJd-27]